jgi:hypothetical protein
VSLSERSRKLDLGRHQAIAELDDSEDEAD